MSLRDIPCNSLSENPDDRCEDCYDTGFVGDHGPGIRDNGEYDMCGCNSVARARRVIARMKAIEAKMK